LEEPGHSSSILIQNQDEEDPQEQQQKQPLGETAMKEDDNGEQEQQGKKRRHLAKTEQIRSDNRHSKRHDHTSDDGDEDPRPAKRRKLPVNTDEMLTPPCEHSPP
jgi:hypothetical protein